MGLGRMRRFLTGAALGVAMLAWPFSGSGGAALADAAAAQPTETWQMQGVAVGPAKVPAGIVSVVLSEAVALPQGGCRLYFGARRAGDGGMDIDYADSPDGANWTFGGTALAGSTDPGNPEFEVAGPSLVQLPDGTWRMYYQACPQFQEQPPGEGGTGGPPAPPKFQMMSAVSPDGIHFTREGVRIAARAYDPSSPFVFAAHGRVVRLADGSYAAVITAMEQLPHQGIYLLKSADGLAFGAPQLLFGDDAHDPLVIKYQNQYLLYGDLSNGNNPAPVSAFIAASGDSLGPVSRPGTAVFLDQQGNPLGFGGGPGNIGDLSGVVLPDGSLRLFSNYNGNSLVYYKLVKGGPPPSGSSGSGSREVVLTVGSTTARADGNPESLPVAPLILGGRTFVPLRFVSQALGADVSWDAAARRVSIAANGKTVVMTEDQTTYTLDGAAEAMDVAPFVAGSGYTMVPVRFVSEALGYQVNWDGATGTVTISQPSGTGAAPKLQEISAPVQVADQARWLFAVNDGQPGLALSMERQGSLLVGRLDSQNPSAPVQWEAAAGPADARGKRIADHWHVFANGYHWLVFSTEGDRTSYLLKLDGKLQRVGLYKVADNLAVTPQEAARDGIPAGTPVITNDMFLTADAGGVAVGHFLPGYGTRVFRFDAGGNLLGTVDVGGGQYVHANLSSAQPVNNGFVIFASATGNPFQQGGVALLGTDADWQPQGRTELLAQDNTNIAMATGVHLSSGFWIVTARVRSLSSAASPVSGGLPDDSGAIVRYIVSPDLQVVSSQVLVAAGANRPHTCLAGNLLVTTWDQGGSGGSQAWLRMDEVTP